VKTHDLSVAAYLKMKGAKLISASREEGKFNFVFDGNETELSKLMLEFVNSDCAKFDHEVRNLKKLVV